MLCARSINPSGANLPPISPSNAVLVAPYYQYPRTASQIYGQALDDNVCLFSWEHLALLLRSGIKESERVTLAPVWSLSAALAERVTVSNKTRNASFHELGNDLICAHLGIERTRLDAELGRYRQATIQRGFEEISFWEARIAEISEFTRERAITELVLALKVNEKISSIRKFIRSIGG
jgi:type II restriction enzyme